MSDLALSSGSSCVVSFMGCYAVLGFIKGSEEEHYVFSNCILPPSSSGQPGTVTVACVPVLFWKPPGYPKSWIPTTCMEESLSPHWGFHLVACGFWEEQYLPIQGASV